MNYFFACTTQMRKSATQVASTAYCEFVADWDERNGRVMNAFEFLYQFCKFDIPSCSSARKWVIQVEIVGHALHECITIVTEICHWMKGWSLFFALGFRDPIPENVWGATSWDGRGTSPRSEICGKRSTSRCLASASSSRSLSVRRRIERRLRDVEHRSYPWTICPACSS